MCVCVCVQTEEMADKTAAVTSWVTDPSQTKSLLQVISDMNFYYNRSLIKCKTCLRNTEYFSRNWNVGN